MPDRCRRAVSGSIMQKKKPVRLDSRAGFRAVWGLAASAAQLPAWAAGCLIWAVWVCAACVRDAAGRSDCGRAGGAGRSPAGVAAGSGAANLCTISPGVVRRLRASERGPGACCGAARAWQLCGFGILPNKFLQRKGPCMYRAIACKSSVLYIRLPCLQVLGPLQEHTTFRESLVCYTSPPGGVYVLGVLPGVSIIRSAGCRGRSGFAPPGPGRPAQSTGLGCPDSQASRARHSHTGFFRSCKAAGYRMVTIRRFQRLS